MNTIFMKWKVKFWEKTSVGWTREVFDNPGNSFYWLLLNITTETALTWESLTGELWLLSLKLLLVIIIIMAIQLGNNKELIKYFSTLDRQILQIFTFLCRGPLGGAVFDCRPTFHQFSFLPNTNPADLRWSSWNNLTHSYMRASRVDQIYRSRKSHTK